MPLKVLEWIKCLDLAQQALLIIFSQTTTTRLSKELLACVWPDAHLNTQKDHVTTPCSLTRTKEIICQSVLAKHSMPAV